MMEMIHEQPFSDLVIQLHDIARIIEKQLGVGQLSSDIRNAADRLHAVTVEKL
jgi:hypothetical protein